ncbi:SCO-spondin-like [Haliotis cracherodii]|uniref:SCO-spondin-like n=1 Tax=Haliotis cracherodii TaxID=6455 RepID=UPI0039ED06C0
MKFLFAVVAVLVVVVLNDVNADTCPYGCKKYQRNNCRYYWYYSSGWRQYYYCSSYRSYTGTCYATCVHGGWSGFSDWETVEDCPVYCGGATALHVRSRSCTNPTPSALGRPCTGDSLEHQNRTCNHGSCSHVCPQDTDTYFEHPKDKKSFYHCGAHGAKAHLKVCENELVWNQAEKTCKEPDTEHPSCNHGEYLPHTEDCRKFFQCSNGQLHLHQCPGGLQFDTRHNLCNWPQMVNCIVDEE